MFTRKLGRNGPVVSALGLGCWAIGGPAWRGDTPIGWGQVDDAESLRSIQKALDLGVTFFDTADVYGCGHSERLLGQALAGKRAQVVIATKFGNVIDEQTRHTTGADASPQFIRRACDASLSRLKTDYIDLYQFHLGQYDPVEAVTVRETLEELVSAGKIRAYGWSTDDPQRARVFAEGPHCTSIQQRLNIFEGNAETLAICERFNLASINRGPLAQGILTGKFTADTQIAVDDVRHKWNLREGDLAARLRKLEALRAVLTRDGRTLAQAALGWVWARSPQTMPIPGFKTVKQIEDNVGALRYGPLNAGQMAEIEKLLAE
jgi:aryl-alcohol dehydrogenase-like predicted oxidoreductase